MKTWMLVLGAAAVGGAVYFCYQNGRKQAFVGVDAVRAGASSYVSKLSNLVSPTCCTGCQGSAAAAAGAAAAPSSSAIEGVSAPIEYSSSTAAMAAGSSCGAS